MPTLPGLDLSQEHYDRVVAAFPGSTLAEKADAYRGWLTNQLIDYVQTVEAQRLQQRHVEQLQAALAELRRSLPPRSLPPRIAPVHDLTPPPPPVITT